MFPYILLLDLVLSFEPLTTSLRFLALVGDSLVMNQIGRFCLMSDSLVMDQICRSFFMTIQG